MKIHIVKQKHASCFQDRHELSQRHVGEHLHS